MATGGSGHCCLTRVKPSTMLARQRSRLSPLEGMATVSVDRLVAADGGEAEVRAAGVEGHDDAFVGVGVHEVMVVRVVDAMCEIVMRGRRGQALAARLGCGAAGFWPPLSESSNR